MWPIHSAHFLISTEGLATPVKAAQEVVSWKAKMIFGPNRVLSIQSRRSWVFEDTLRCWKCVCCHVQDWTTKKGKHTNKKHARDLDTYLTLLTAQPTLSVQKERQHLRALNMELLYYSIVGGYGSELEDKDNRTEKDIPPVRGNYILRDHILPSPSIGSY